MPASPGQEGAPGKAVSTLSRGRGLWTSTGSRGFWVKTLRGRSACHCTCRSGFHQRPVRHTGEGAGEGRLSSRKARRRDRRSETREAHQPRHGEADSAPWQAQEWAILGRKASIGETQRGQTVVGVSQQG